MEVQLTAIKILAEKLSDKINISAAAARGLIKLAIKDKVDPFTPINQLHYQEFVASIETTLLTRLINLEIENAVEIIEYLLEECTKIQSLFTLGEV